MGGPPRGIIFIAPCLPRWDIAVYLPFMSFLQFPGSNCSSQQSTDGAYCASTNLMAEVASACCASQSGRKALFTAVVTTATFLFSFFNHSFIPVASIEGSAIATVPSVMMLWWSPGLTVALWLIWSWLVWNRGTVGRRWLWGVTVLGKLKLVLG